MADEGEAGVDDIVSLRVFVDLAGHGADHGEFVRKGGEVWKQIGHFGAGMTAWFRFPRAAHDVAVVVEHRGFHRHGHWLAVAALQLGLGIERVDVGDSAAHVGEDDVFGPGAEVGCADGA